MIKIKEFCPEGWRIDTNENRKAISSPTTLSEAMLTGEVLEANVLMCDSNHNLLVELGCMKGIIPRNEGALGIESGEVRDIALISRVGKPVSFVVKEICTDKNGKLYAKLSRKAAQEKFLEHFLSFKKCGSVIGARVTHLESFGAFCDIGCGVVALLPIDAISVSRISHPRDRFNVGDNLKVVVRAIGEDGKITLTHKELLGSWEENAQNFSEGQTVSGIIRSIESYGIFVELTPNLAGLAEPKQGAEPGMTASVYIKSIIKEKMKVKLIIIDNFKSNFKSSMNYFYEEDYMDYWKYSPENCAKNIFTDFLLQ